MADHLTPDRLAALVDDEPTVAEAAHLAACAACARERAAFDAMLALAGADASQITAPLTSWETLAPALRSAGLIRPALPERSLAVSGEDATRSREGRAAGPARALVSPWQRVRRIAAVLLLVGGGAVVGRYSAHGADASLAGGGAGTARGSDGATASAASGPASASGAAATPAPGGLVVSAADPAYAGLPQLHDSVPIFHSPAEALATLSRAEREYRHAAAYLVSADQAGTVDDRREAYRTRLAALDEVAQATRAALAEAPQDPVLHEYYQSSVNAREATIRELRGALPVGMRLDRY